MRDKKRGELILGYFIFVFFFLVGNVFFSLVGLEFEWSVLLDISIEGEEMVDIFRY